MTQRPGPQRDRPRPDVVVAVLARRGRFLVAEPLFHRSSHIDVERDKRAREGDLVLVGAGSRGHGRAKVIRVIGRPDVARDVLEGLLLERGLHRRFSPAIEREAQEVAENGPPDVARRDLRDLPTFTIDPVTARDFDDAISAQREADGRARVWVHIADVSAYVRPGSPIDREARRRATSVYVPGAVEPMLPETLSNGACSLVPGQDRLAVTAELEFRGAAVVSSSFYRSLIRSDERLDYDRVDQIFAGSERAAEPWAEPLAVARETAAALDDERRRRGALAVESSEPEFAFDRHGHVAKTWRSIQTESHRLVEHLMIAANEAVARLLVDRRAPALFRVHERPDVPRVEHLIAQLDSLDVPTPALPENTTPQQAADIVAEASRIVAAEARRRGHGAIGLGSLVLRSLKQAHYSPRNLGHAGLHSEAYCHFTSPIRRYPDLVCHRALLSLVGGGEEPPVASELEELGSWTSQRERDAMAIERTADDIAHCFLLERELFETGWEHQWEGEVTGLVGAGAFIVFGDDGYEGMLPVRMMRGDWWDINELDTMLVAAQSGRTIRIGDPVEVQVASVESPRGRVDLLPIPSSEAKSR